MDHERAPPSVAQLCRLYIDGWTYIEANAPASAFVAGDRERIGWLKTLADPMSGRVKTLEHLSALVELGSNMSVAHFGYKPIQPLTASSPMTLEQTCFQFGVGRLGWYFAKGANATWGFSWILFRSEVAPPAVVAASGIAPEHAVLYSLTGGAGLIKGKWRTVPRNVFQARQFVCQATQDNGDGFRVAFASVDSSCGVRCSIDIDQDGWVRLTAAFPIVHDDVHETNDQDASGSVEFSCGMRPVKGTSPVYNAPYGCFPCLSDGSGTSYWSMTDMAGPGQYLELADSTGTSIERRTADIEHGWFDHQWMHTSVSPQPPGAVTRWLWLPIQLDGGRRQYMISVIFSPTDPSVEHGVRKGAVYDATVVNRYRSGGFVQGWDHEYDQDSLGDEQQQTVLNQTLVSAQLTIVETAEFRGSSFPTSVHIALTERLPPSTDGKADADGDVTHHLLLVNAFHKTHSRAIVLLPSGVWNWEGPADLYDLSPLVKGDRTQALESLDLKRLDKIGAGFLEANQMVTATQIVRTQAAPLVADGLVGADVIAAVFEPQQALHDDENTLRPAREDKAAARGVTWETIALFLLAILAVVLIVLGVWWTAQRVHRGQGATAYAYAYDDGAGGGLDGVDDGAYDSW